MRHPSARMFPSLVDVYRQTSWTPSTKSPQVNTDVEGGFSPVYPTAPSARGAVCSIQYVGDEEDLSTLGRITEVRLYHLFFPSDPRVAVRDKLSWVDSTGDVRTAYVRASKDMGFYGVCYRVEAIERL